MPTHEDNDNIIIERKRKVNKTENKDDNSKQKKIKSKKRMFDKHWKIIAVLLMFISVFLFLSLISYTSADETNASITTGEIFKLISGDRYIQAKAATTNNWLGLFGAVISYRLINGTFGYAIIFLPFFIIAWSKVLFTGEEISKQLARNTSVYLLLGILLAGLIGSIRNISWMFEISKEWSGTIGIFLGTIISNLISPIGGFIFFTAAIFVTLMIGTDLNFEPLIERIYAYIGKTSYKITDTIKDKMHKNVDTPKEENEIITEEKPNYEPELNPKPLVIKEEEKVENKIEMPNITRNFPDPVIKRNDKKDASDEIDIEQELDTQDNPLINEDFEINIEAAENTVTSYQTEFEPEYADDEDVELEVITKDDKEIAKIIRDEPKEIYPETPILSKPADKKLVVTVEEFEEDEIDEDLLEDSPLGTAIHDEEINYVKPGFDLLVQKKEEISVNDDELKMNAKILQEKLETFKIYIENLSVTPGPVVTQYEFVPAEGIKVSKIASLQDDLAMALKARGIRIIAPIPGKGTVGVEIPNSNPAIVRFNDVVRSVKYAQAKEKLPLALGKTINGEIYIADLAKMPHLLIAGSTGSGKSVGINTIICSLLYKMHPSELKFIIIDPKKVEMQQYSMLKKHYMASSPDIKDTIVTKPEDAVAILKSAVIEMEQRYDILAKVGQRNIKDYNEKVIEGKYQNDPNMVHRPMPYIVVIVDELADLMLTASKEIEEPITRLAQMARAVGIHLVIATQRPSVDVITGLIKANFPARIAYMVASKIDSRTILDMQGAEHLLGMGDMLCLLAGESKPVRVQNAFISTDEVEAICEFVSKQKGYSMPYQLPSIMEKVAEGGGIAKEDRDPLFEDAARLIIRHQQGSVSLLQRRLKIGYARAGRIVDELESAGVIGPFDGSKARLVLMESESDLEAIL